MNRTDDIDRLSRDALGGYSEAPPAYIAEKISKRMLWYNLWHFKFIANLRYILPATAVIIGAVVLLHHTGSTETSKPATGIAKHENMLRHDVNLISSASAGVQSGNNATKNPLTEATVNRSGEATGITSQQEPQQKKTGQQVMNSVMPAGGSSAQNETGNTSVTASQEDHNNNNVIAGKTENKEASMQANEEKKAEVNNNTSFVEVQKDQQVNAPQTPADRIMEIINTVPYLHTLSLANDNSGFVAFNEKKSSPSYKRKPLFDLNLGIAPLVPSFSGIDKDVKAKPAMPSGLLSLTVNYHLNHLLVGTGIQYTCLQTGQKGNDLLYNEHDITSQNIIGQQLLIDTAGYWHLRLIEDSVIHFVDSVWEMRFDSSYNNIYQAVTTKAADTLKEQSWKASVSLIEIPLMLGYRFYIGRAELSVRGGILIGIVTKAGGTVYYKESSTGLVRIQDLYSTKGLQISYFVSGSIARNVTEHWALELSPYWRGSISGLKGKEGNAKMKYNAWGANVGLRYEF